MKTQRLSRPTLFAALLALATLLAASAFAVRPLEQDGDKALSIATIRAEIDAVYKQWGQARIAYDNETMEAILAPDFWVLLDGREISREEFLTYVSAPQQGARLTRFDVDVLTVQRTDEEWSVVITEKLELEVPGPNDSKQTVYSFWVTRDGCRKQDGKWLVTSSEAIGHEDWLPGTKPPIRDW